MILKQLFLLSINMNKHFILIFLVDPDPEGREENQFGGF
jgi:hypothetical protein